MAPIRKAGAAGEMWRTLLLAVCLTGLCQGEVAPDDDAARLLIGDGAPLRHWLHQIRATGGEPHASGSVLLTGNASAHAEALRGEVAAHSSGSDASYLLAAAAWHEISCSDGCGSLMDSVSHVLRDRAGIWTVVFVTEAEHAAPFQVASLVGRFWRSARCSHATASWQLNVDCRRTLFALSTGIGADVLEGEPQPLPGRGVESVAAGAGISGVGTSSTSARLRDRMLRECSAWLASVEAAAATSQRPARAMRKAMAVALGSPGGAPFAALVARQKADRDQRRAEEARDACGWAVGDEVCASGATCSAACRSGDVSRPDPAAFGRLVGQEAVVAEVRGRLDAILSGADGGEDAHVFFFYGFPGTGKTYLAELIARAAHGSTALPHYKKFAMQNYKTEADLNTLRAPPCGYVGGEAAFEKLFGPRAQQLAATGSGEAPARVGPVLVFDEIEEASKDFMTNALVNAIDHRGFVEYRPKKVSVQNEAGSAHCDNLHAPTAGSIFVLTSNCFMDDLAQVLAEERVPGRPAAEVYEATRVAMEQRIFDDGIPCSRADGRASPFAVDKMRDRMLGNVWPFLPLSDEQNVATFELELEKRAATYVAANNVSLHWTSEFASLAMPAAAAAAVSRSKDAAAAAAPTASIRKRIDMLMRLDPQSVERLYGAGVARCRPARMHSLVLHVRGGKPAGEPLCDNSTLTPTGPRARDGASLLPSAQRASGAPPAPSHDLPSPGVGALEPAPMYRALDARVDAPSDARLGAAQTDVEKALQSRLEEALQMNAERQVELEALRVLVTELQQSIWYWKLACALLALATAATLLFAVLSTSYVALAYTAALAKMAMWLTVGVAVVLVVAAATAALLCLAGNAQACQLQELMLWVARAALSAIRLGWRLLRWLAGTMGPWGVVLALVVAVGLVLTARWLRRRVQRAATRGLEEERNAARSERDAATAERDAAIRVRGDAILAVGAATCRAAELERNLAVERGNLEAGRDRAEADAHAMRGEVRHLEDSLRALGVATRRAGVEQAQEPGVPSPEKADVGGATILSLTGHIEDDE